MSSSRAEIIDLFGARGADVLRQAASLPSERERLVGFLIELRAFSAALSRAVALEEVAGIVLDRALPLLGADAGTIAWLAEPETLSLLAARGATGEWRDRPRRVPVNAPLPACAAARSGRPVWIGGEDDVERQFPGVADGWRAQGRPTWVAIPLLIDDEPVGVLGLSFRAGRTLDAPEQALAVALAQESATALERARLHEAERSLLQSADRSRALLDTFIANLPLGLALLDRELRYVRVNPALAAMNRLPVEAHAGRRLREVLSHPRWAPSLGGLEAMLRRVLDAGATFEDVPSAIEDPPGSGRTAHALLGLFPVRAGDGAIVGAGAIVRDVTALHEAEEARQGALEALAAMAATHRESEALLDTLFTHAPIGLALFGRDFRYQRVNRSLAAFNGLPPEAHLGRTPRELLPAFPSDEIEAAWHRALETGAPVLGVETTGETPAAPGQRRSWIGDWYPVRVAGEVAGVGLVVREITEEKRAAELRSLLVGIVGHDIRNPLGVARGSALLLEQTGLDERQRALVARIQRATAQIDNLAAVLLDYTLARAGRQLPLAPREVDLGALLLAAVEDAQTLHPDRVFSLAGDGDGRGLLDPDRVRQLAGNLLANAAKHGDVAAPVRVTWRGEPETLAFEVQNGGAPIPPEQLPILFEPLQRAGTGRGGGIGLGLFIARAIAAAHGGTIGCRSTAADGTVLWVRLPRRSPGA